MRYLITSTRSDAQIILGYDENGMLCEVQAANLADPDHRIWPFRHAPIMEGDVSKVFKQEFLRFTTLEVTFEEFWKKYNYKEGKKDADNAWKRMTQASQQLAFNYIEKYRAACHRDRKHLQYPASYLRAERWLDQT